MCLVQFISIRYRYLLRGFCILRLSLFSVQVSLSQVAITIIYIIGVNPSLNIALYKAIFVMLIVTIYGLIGQLVANTIGREVD